MSTPRVEPRYVLCLRNDGYEASLVVRRLYQRIADPDAARHGLVWVIDESGEDYLFPAEFFAAIAVPKALGRKLPVATWCGPVDQPSQGAGTRAPVEQAFARVHKRDRRLGRLQAGCRGGPERLGH